MKKKNIANMIMVIVIVLIVAAGILSAGHIRGWFEKPDPAQAVLHSTKGVTEILRDGIRFPVSSDTVLHNGDALTCQDGATAQIRFGEDLLVLGEKAVLTVEDASANTLRLQVQSGEVFACCQAGVTLCFESDTLTIGQATVLLSVRSGAQSLGVFSGSVKQASAGQIIHYVAGSETVEQLDLNSLNDFTITQIRQLENVSLCFTIEDLDRLAAQRQQAIQQLISSQEQTGATDPTQSTSTQSSDPTTATTGQESDATTAATTPTGESTATQATTPTEDTVSTEPTATQPAPPAVHGSCTIAIYCTTILNNMDDLEPGKAEFVPSDGVILYPVTVNFTEGETVFDVLKRVCSITGIQLEYSWTPMYNSYYVEGIHQLYEFDCGFESGWMYQVNGWFPNYGCSSYGLKDGDVIVWNYTCQGLGADLGARIE